jgi:SUR7/PalI family
MGSLVMLFFVILAGVTTTPPLNNTYFLQASTQGITGARAVSRWTYFYVCGDDNLNCGPAYPALPFGYAWAGNPQSASGELVGDFGGGTTSYYYWYMWRFGWVFYLITLFFSVMAFFCSFLACCGRLGSAIAALVSTIALFFNTIAVSLMT